MDVGLRPQEVAQIQPQHDVSILVLVDVGLRLAPGDDIVISVDGFNPCFSGCWSATRRRNFYRWQHKGFQSLF